jgi:hypothetical protein
MPAPLQTPTQTFHRLAEARRQCGTWMDAFVEWPSAGQQALVQTAMNNYLEAWLQHQSAQVARLDEPAP